MEKLIKLYSDPRSWSDLIFRMNHHCPWDRFHRWIQSLYNPKNCCLWYITLDVWANQILDSFLRMFCEMLYRGRVTYGSAGAGAGLWDNGNCSISRFRFVSWIKLLHEQLRPTCRSELHRPSTIKWTHWENRVISRTTQTEMGFWETCWSQLWIIPWSQNHRRLLDEIKTLRRVCFQELCRGRHQRSA